MLIIKKCNFQPAHQQPWQCHTKPEFFIKSFCFSYSLEFMKCLGQNKPACFQILLVLIYCEYWFAVSARKFWNICLRFCWWFNNSANDWIRMWRWFAFIWWWHNNRNGSSQLASSPWALNDSCVEFELADVISFSSSSLQPMKKMQWYKKLRFSGRILRTTFWHFPTIWI